jgi:hypothetical protein
MNSISSGRMTARASGVAASSRLAGSWPMRRPALIRRLARPLATKASQSSIDAASI